MENLAIVEAQIASSRMDGGSKITFTSETNMKLGDYVTLDYGKPRPLEFRIDIISAQEFPQVYVITASFKGPSYLEAELDVRTMLSLKVNVVNEEQNKQFKKSEGLI